MKTSYTSENIILKTNIIVFIQCGGFLITLQLYVYIFLFNKKLLNS